MEWLNYHHLLYFWMVAREGTIAQACRQLRLTQPTISGQIRALEDSLGEKLFVRAGRRLALTETGRLVYRYADEIFTIGRELSDTLKGRPTGRPLRFRVGIAEGIPKLIAYRFIEPALRLQESMRITCREGSPAELLAELIMHGLDIVMADSPVGPGSRVRAFNHLLGECGVTLFAAGKLVSAYKKGFPGSLDGAPFLFPTDNSTLRRSLEHWFETIRVRPNMVGEFDDSALLKVFGRAKAGVFAAHSVIEAEVISQYDVGVIGRVESIRERFYALSGERKVTHPAVVAVLEAAAKNLPGK